MSTQAETDAFNLKQLELKAIDDAHSAQIGKLFTVFVDNLIDTINGRGQIVEGEFTPVLGRFRAGLSLSRRARNATREAINA